MANGLVATLLSIIFPLWAVTNGDVSLQLPGLGRSFQLGDLYDARQDRLVAPGLSLWKKSKMKAATHVEAKPFTRSQVFQAESFSARADRFKMKAEIKASFASGLFSVHGAGTLTRPD